MKTGAVILLRPLFWGRVGGPPSSIARRAGGPTARFARHHRVVHNYFDNIGHSAA